MASTGEERATRAFRARFHAEPTVVARAPGRVNLIGEHVDYNEGFVLPAAIDRAAWVAAAPTDGDAVTIEAVDFAESVSFDVDETNEKRNIRGEPLPRWALYAAGVANELARRGHRVRAIDAALASDVPIGAGLSSSAAIEVAFATVWRRLGDLAIDSLELAKLCQQAENGYVGVRCGLMDQFVSVHGEAGHALLLDCRSLASKTVRLPQDVRLVVADSKVRRELAASEFNVRRRECELAVEGLRAVLPGIRSLRDVSPEDLERHGGVLGETLRRRARHVVGEIARVRDVIPAIERGDAIALGAAMIAAHQSGRHLYEVSCHELDVLVDTAITLDGCYGARLTGAGFGGCTVSLVAMHEAERFVTKLGDAYRAATGITPELWLCSAAAGAGVTARRSA